MTDYTCYNNFKNWLPEPKSWWTEKCPWILLSMY